MSTQLKTPTELAADVIAKADTETYFSRTITDWMVAAIEADHVQRSNYLLSFEPGAIREHFEADSHFADLVDTLSDDELTEIAANALQSDKLYNVFHELLRDGVMGI